VTCDVTSEETSDSAGSTRYVLAIMLPDPQGHKSGDSICFAVNGLAIPQAGDGLCFDAADISLMLTVSRVTHWFYPTEEGPNHREIRVLAEPSSFDVEYLRRVKDSSELYARMVNRFAALDFDPFDLGPGAQPR
jgi:hypothetical protein